MSQLRFRQVIQHASCNRAPVEDSGLKLTAIWHHHMSPLTAAPHSLTRHMDNSVIQLPWPLLEALPTPTAEPRAIYSTLLKVSLPPMRLFCLILIGGSEILAPSAFPLWKFCLYRNTGKHFHVHGMQPAAPLMFRHGHIWFRIGIACQSAWVLALF